MAVNAKLSESDLIFRILNFKEDIHRELLLGNYGTVVDATAMDRALAPVTITVPRKRHYGHISRVMAEALRRHGVADAIQITAEHS